MIEAKRVPYGVSDFTRVIRENQYYVDKTMYIPLLEAQPDNPDIHSPSPLRQEPVPQYARSLL